VLWRSEDGDTGTDVLSATNEERRKKNGSNSLRGGITTTRLWVGVCVQAGLFLRTDELGIRGLEELYDPRAGERKKKICQESGECTAAWGRKGAGDRLWSSRRITTPEKEVRLEEGTKARPWREDGGITPKRARKSQ